MNKALVQVDGQVRWHGLLKSAPLVIILLYMHLRQMAITRAELAECFAIDRKTAGVYLRQMTKAGLIVHVGHNDGYALMDGGQQMLLDLDMAGGGIIGPPTLKESFNYSLKDSKIKKEGKKERANFWTCPESLTTEKILSETGGLFGAATISFGIADRDPAQAMTLVAHAYDQRARLAKPQVFVYRRLQLGTPSDKKYHSDPLAYLPNSYLVALGIAEPKIIVVDDDALDQEQETGVASSDETVLQHITGQVNAAEAWRIVLVQLQYDMPTTSYNRVRNTFPVHWEEGRLQVGVCDPPCRDWLESRLKSTADRLLTGILNRAVEVEFVVVGRGDAND